MTGSVILGGEGSVVQVCLCEYMCCVSVPGYACVCACLFRGGIVLRGAEEVPRLRAGSRVYALPPPREGHRETGTLLAGVIFPGAFPPLFGRSLVWRQHLWSRGAVFWTS